MGKAIIIAVKMLMLNEGRGSPMGQVLSDILAPMTFALGETGPGRAASKKTQKLQLAR